MVAKFAAPQPQELLVQAFNELHPKSPPITICYNDDEELAGQFWRADDGSEYVAYVHPDQRGKAMSEVLDEITWVLLQCAYFTKPFAEMTGAERRAHAHHLNEMKSAIGVRYRALVAEMNDIINGKVAKN